MMKIQPLNDDGTPNGPKITLTNGQCVQLPGGGSFTALSTRRSKKRRRARRRRNPPSSRRGDTMQIHFAKNGFIFTGTKFVDRDVPKVVPGDDYEEALAGAEARGEPTTVSMKVPVPYVRPIRDKADLLDAVRTELNQGKPEGVSSEHAYDQFSAAMLPSPIRNVDVINACKGALTISHLDEGFGVVYSRKVDVPVKASFKFVGEDDERKGIEYEGKLNMLKSLPPALRQGNEVDAHVFFTVDEVIGFVSEVARLG